MNSPKRFTNRQKKRLAGYEPSTPRCETCISFQRHSPGKPDEIDPTTGVAGPKWQPFIPARCLIGDFPVQPVGLCDDWEGRDGSRLEVDE